VVGLGAALLLNQSFKGRKFVRSVILLPYVAPVISLVFVWQYLFNPVYGMVNYVLVEKLHLFNDSVDWLDNPDAALWLVILFDIWHLFPFSFLMILAKLQSIDSSLYEAAEIDGAGTIQKFRRITVPLISSTTFLVLIMSTISTFQAFEQIYVMTGGAMDASSAGGPNKASLVLMIYLYQEGFSFLRMGYASAIAWVLFVILFLLTVVQMTLQKKWVHYE